MLWSRRGGVGILRRSDPREADPRGSRREFPPRSSQPAQRNAGAQREIFTADAVALLHEAASGGMRDLDRLATGCLREAARKKRKLVERDLLPRQQVSKIGNVARQRGAMVPLDIFANAPFNASLAIAGLMTFGMYALLFIMPLYFQTIRGATPFIAGLELLPMSVSFVVVSQLVGYLTNNLGPRIVMAAGMACMGFGALAIAFISENTSLVFIALALFVVGIGLGLNTAPVNGVAVAAVPPARSGTASGVLNTARMVGATMGVAVLGSVFAAYAGQQANVAAGFMPGLRAAIIAAGSAELLGAIIAAPFLRAVWRRNLRALRQIIER